MSESRFDIAIIGGGIAGASAGAELARTHRVAMLERESFCGYHATGRSAALFSETYGNAVVRALSRASRSFLFAPEPGFAEYELVKPRGALHIATREQMDQLEAFAAQPDMREHARMLDAEDALAACPVLRADITAGGVLEPAAADVDVNGLHQGCLRRLKQRGGTIVTDAEVRSLSFRGGVWNVETAAGNFQAPIVVNASGAWTDDVARLAGARPCNIVPCRRTALLAELPPGVDAAAWPMVIDIDEEFYFKPDAGLLLISPADETPVVASDVQPEELDVAIAIDRVENATTLKVTRLRKRWAGLRSFAPDRTPVIGFDPDVEGFFWLAGQGGFGIQTSPAAARLAAALVRNDAPVVASIGVDTAALSPLRFHPGR